jgi:hypothetical protein
MDGSPAMIPELYLGWGSTFSLRPVDSATGKVLGESEERRAFANHDDEVLGGLFNRDAGMTSAPIARRCAPNVVL